MTGRTFRESAQVLMLLLSTHRVRPRDSLLIAAGFLITTATLAVMLAIPSGIERIGSGTGQSTIALALSASASDEVSSSLTPEQVAVLSGLPGIAKFADGKPMMASQFLANTKLDRADGQRSTVLVRGINAQTLELLDPGLVDLTNALHFGSREVAVSNTLRSQFPALDRSSVTFQGRDWRVASGLETGGSLWESEIWTDFSALQAAFNRSGRSSSVWLRLSSEDALDELQAAVRDDPRLQDVRVVRQTDYYQQQVGFLVRFVRLAAVGISVLLGTGAVLAISTTLGMALERRRREMATLRAIGFSDGSIVIASLLDVLLQGAIATALALLGVYALLDGASFGTSSANSAVYASFSVSAGVMGMVFAYSLALGLLSAALPIKRVLGGKLVDALKD